MSRKNIVLIIGLIVIGFILFILLSSPNQNSTSLENNINVSRNSSLNIIASNNVSNYIEGDHILEYNNPINTIVEYASLTCPHCAVFHNEVFPRIKEDLIDTGKVKYVFRDFPIDPIAMAGSMIAHCSGDDKYFGVINVLLKTQDQWLMQNENPYNGLLKVARLAGLAEEDVKMCLNNSKIFNLIENNQKMATSRFGVTGTPSVFVNGKKISTLSYEAILNELEISYGNN